MRAFEVFESGFSQRHTTRESKNWALLLLLAGLWDGDEYVGIALTSRQRPMSNEKMFLKLRGFMIK
jgi:hypothetical protein